MIVAVFHLLCGVHWQIFFGQRLSSILRRCSYNFSCLLWILSKIDCSTCILLLMVVFECQLECLGYKKNNNSLSITLWQWPLMIAPRESRISASCTGLFLLLLFSNLFAGRVCFTFPSCTRNPFKIQCICSTIPVPRCSGPQVSGPSCRPSV